MKEKSNQRKVGKIAYEGFFGGSFCTNPSLFKTPNQPILQENPVIFKLQTCKNTILQKFKENTLLTILKKFELNKPLFTCHLKISSFMNDFEAFLNYLLCCKKKHAQLPSSLNYMKRPRRQFIETLPTRMHF